VSRVLVDANVLLDVATEDARWGGWSEAILAEVARAAVLVINTIIYGEVSVGYDTIEELDAAVPSHIFLLEPIPFEAGFLAGTCYRA
jgi:predicted nucleic acid-binding protein